MGGCGLRLYPGAPTAVGLCGILRRHATLPVVQHPCSLSPPPSPHHLVIGGGNCVHQPLLDGHVLWRWGEGRV